MDRFAEKLAKWFGSAPFIFFHILWFGAWIALHFFAKFDQEWQVLTLVVSLEAIFLSLFILRAENVESARAEKQVKKDYKKDKEALEILRNLYKKK